jgi:hypothetical protein
MAPQQLHFVWKICRFHEERNDSSCNARCSELLNGRSYYYHNSQFQSSDASAARGRDKCFLLWNDRHDECRYESYSPAACVRKVVVSNHLFVWDKVRDVTVIDGGMDRRAGE